MTAARAAAPPRVRHVVLADGSLFLESDAGLAPLLERWLPLLPYERRVPRADGARLRLREISADADEAERPAGRPSLVLGSATAWVRGDRVRLRGAAGVQGRIHLRRAAAALAVPAGGDAEAAAWDVYSMATLATALLLGRAGRALVHAAAPVSPDGRAWLLVGDTHAGKSTTCVNLLAAGWRFASDDHVVLDRGPDGRLWVEGLPRPFHLDEGWGSSRPEGVRTAVDPHRRWPGQWQERAPLGGLLLPCVEAGRPTTLVPVSPADALAALIRQSPWLIADGLAAPAILALLGDAARGPAHGLRLGLDTFADPARLSAVLSGLGGPPDTAAGVRR